MPPARSWSRGGLYEPTDPVQGLIPLVNDIEIRKQLSKMGRNKACGPDDLPIEAITMVSEMKPELLGYIRQRNNGKWYIR